MFFGQGILLLVTAAEYLNAMGLDIVAQHLNVLIFSWGSYEFACCSE